MIEVWQRISISDTHVIEPWQEHNDVGGWPGTEPWMVRGIVIPTAPVEPWQRLKQSVTPPSEPWQRRLTTFV